LPVSAEASEAELSGKEVILLKKGIWILLMGIGVVLIGGALLSLVLLTAWNSDSSASPEQSGPATSSQPSASELLYALTTAGANDSSQPQGIGVTGEGRASAAPDIVVLGLGVSAKASTVDAANSQVQEAMSDLLASLEANGVQEKDIQTSGFSIYPEYDYRNDEQILTGYRVSHMLQVKVRDVDGVGEVIDDAVEAGGDLLQVQSISFAIDDTTALSSEARQEAMADAQAKAEELASLAGVTLGKPTYITESLYSPSSQPYFYAERMALPATGGDETAISAGELEVVVTVNITYSIQQ
jgi:uncharacterized protein YggE